jgi:hypothetical protein
MESMAADKKKFSDYIRLHTEDGHVISMEGERELLKKAVVDFSLDLDQARGILMHVAEDEDITLESDVNAAVKAYLQQIANRRGGITHRQFKGAVAMYTRMTGNALEPADVKKRVKGLMERAKLHPRRSGLLLRTRRWYKKI